MTTASNERRWAEAKREESPWRLSLVIDTDAHAGNVIRLLRAAAFGSSDGSSGEAVALAAAYDGPSFDDVVEGSEVWPTPGYGSDGHGGVHEVAPDRSAALPAYCSVRFGLARELTPGEMASVVGRVAALAATGGPRSVHGRQGTPPFRVLGFRLMRSRTVTESVRVADTKPREAP